MKLEQDSTGIAWRLEKKNYLQIVRVLVVFCKHNMFPIKASLQSHSPKCESRFISKVWR